MRRTRQASWTIAVDEPGFLLNALFVRDAAGLRPVTDPEIPALTPRVTIGPPPQPATRRSAAEQWAQWWSRLIDADHRTPAATPSNFPELADHPDLRELMRAYFSDAIRWSSERQREHANFMVRSNRPPVETDVVGQVENAFGRTARPFSLRVTELPVAGKRAWRIGPGHLVVTRELFTDTRAYRRRLLELVEELA